MTDIVQEIYLYQPPKYIHFSTVSRKTGDFKRDGWLCYSREMGSYFVSILYDGIQKPNMYDAMPRQKYKRKTATQNMQCRAQC